MKNSPIYNKLCSRIAKLEHSYLPTSKNPLKKYTKKEEDDIKAYSLLVHAELEAYFEDMAREKAQDALRKWRLNPQKYSSYVLLSLSCFIEQNNKIKNQPNTESKLRTIVGVFCEKIKANHGIKEDNIKDLLLPIGVAETDLDTTWLNTITSFGAIRGEVAHSSYSVVRALNHNDIKDDVNKILADLKSLDIIINALR